MEYVIVIIAAIICSYFSEKFFQTKKRVAGVLLATFAIMLPVMLAGFRTIDIGTDVRFYLIKDYQYAINSSDLAEYSGVVYGEPLFAGTVYFVANIFGNINVVMFFLSFITVFTIYVGCWRFRKKAPVYLIFGFFLFVYFNMSLNLIRQSLALSFSFLALSYLFDKKWVKYLALVGIASLFHITAVVMLFVMILYLIIPRIKNKVLLYIGTVIGASMLFIGFGEILRESIRLGILNEKYIYYAESGNVDVSITYIGFSVAVFLVILFCRKKILKDEESKFLIFGSFVNVLLLGLSLRYNTAERLTYYFGYMNVLSLPIVISKLLMPKINAKNRLIKYDKKTLLILFLYFGGLASYHTIYYNILKNHKTYPYNTVIKIGNRNDGSENA